MCAKPVSNVNAINWQQTTLPNFKIKIELKSVHITDIKQPVRYYKKYESLN